MLDFLKKRFSSRDRLPDEIRTILQDQEMAGERLVNYVRAIFAALSLSAVVFVVPGAQTPTTTKIYTVVTCIWLVYAACVWLLVRRRDRYYRWLKYLSITVDITSLFVNQIAGLKNHSGVYEVYRSPTVWLVLAAFSVMAGLRYSVFAGFYSSALVAFYSTALLVYVRFTATVPWIEVSAYIGPGLNIEEIIYAIVFTSVNGVFAAVIAWNSRKLILQSAMESLARERLEQDRDRSAKYFSKDVVDLVLNNPESLALGGQRMTATVLFADIRNFTQLSTMMQPEEVVDLLNRYFSTMVEIVFKNGGTLDKFLGDGLMALFGVPYPIGKPEERAVRTALEMLDALQIMNRELEAKGMLRLDIGVGINSGPVVAGNIGSAQRHEYTVIGDTVNLAARLEALNKETRTQILVSAPIYEAIRDVFRSRSLGPLRIRGKPEPVDVHAISALRRRGRAPTHLPPAPVLVLPVNVDLTPFPSYLEKQAEIDAAWQICEAHLGASSLLDELAERFFSSIGDAPEGHRAYFSNPLAPPLLYLPIWLRDALASRGALPAHPGAALSEILAGSMLGYFYVRIQDDTLDEPERADPELLLLGNVCFSGMVRLFASALGGQAGGFFSAFDRAFADFSRLTLAEQRAVRGGEPYPAALFEEHADKVAFARIPMLAVAALAGRLELEAPIRELVHRLGIAYGLANDVMGWPRDLRAGHRTHLLAEAGLDRATVDQIHGTTPGPARDILLAETAEQLRAPLYEGSLLHTTIGRAIAAQKSAATVAQELDLGGFDAFSRERITWLEKLDRGIVASTLKRVLSGAR